MAEDKSQATAADTAGRSSFGKTEQAIALMALGLLAAVVAGVVLVFHFVGAEWERDLRTWQNRLGIIAESRVAELDGWLARQRDEIHGLAINPTIELLLSELAAAQGDPAAIPDAEAQLGYVTNLLEVTADRTGFLGPVLGPEVPANVSRVAVEGLALFDLQGRLLANVPAALSAGLPADPATAAAMEIIEDASGQPSLWLVEPVYPIQSDRAPGSEIGYVVGQKQLEGELYPLLEQPGTSEASLGSVLLRGHDHLVEYLSPPGDGRGGLEVALDRSTAELAGGFALDHTGGFAVKRDFADQEVLVTSRVLSGLPWVLMTKIDRAEALAGAEARLQRLLITFLLVIGVVALTLVAVWRHGASRRAARSAELYRETAEKLEQQRNLLRLVTDTQPTSIFIADTDNRYRFANRMTAEKAGISQDALIGKRLEAVLGPAYAARYTSLNRAALDSGQPAAEQARVRANGSGERVLYSEHIPMTNGAVSHGAGSNAPGANGSAHPASVLVVERDITTEVTERERRVRALNGLVETLVHLVDQRDPYAADHSIRVGTLAACLAEEMGLDDEERDTARISGTLMNLGKILVPSAMLASGGSLSEEEQQQVRQSIQVTAALLEHVEFDGPVIEALSQSQERVDGLGQPDGLSGDEILEPARILAVANAFIGMISERAHRAGLSVDVACGELLKSIDQAYDRRVVAALINFLDNKNGRAAYEAEGDRPGPDQA